MHERRMRAMSRRDFLRTLASAAGGMAAATLLNGCKPTAPAGPTQPPAATKVTGPTVAPPSAVSLRLWSHSNPAFVKANEA
ncbi:MAG: twin-arginine translocation signal domain-containing protein, partial [Anaerolineae bacterium]|nr:twin-arginine translocation signal domain-containing protein [Anaerolineae bacterium]